MSDWTMTITRVANGYIVKSDDGMDLDEVEVVDGLDVEGGLTLLDTVINHFDLRGSRHDARRLVPRIEPGDKHHDYHPTPCKDCPCGCDPDQSGT
jgi:hypothetical protein